MKGVITSLSRTTKLFKSPKRIGEIIEHQDNLYLIIGIEDFKVHPYTQELTVWYTAQNLTNHDFISKQSTSPESRLEEMYFQSKYDSERFERFKLGRTIPYKGKRYKIMEYTDITLDGTDIRITVLVRKVTPIDRKKAKSRFLSERRKQIEIDIL